MTITSIKLVNLTGVEIMLSAELGGLVIPANGIYVSTVEDFSLSSIVSDKTLLDYVKANSVLV